MEKRKGRGRPAGSLNKVKKVRAIVIVPKEEALYQNILTRCYNPKGTGYCNYGGRGIKMYPEWIMNKQVFIEYVRALDNFNVSGYTLDRIDNDGDYEPGNIRWASREEQAVNRRKNSRNKLGYTGISTRRNKRTITYLAHIMNIHIGCFKTVEQAVEARNQYIKDNNLLEKIQEIEWKQE